MKAFGFNFVYDVNLSSSGVIYQKNINQAVKQVKEEINKELGHQEDRKSYYKAIQSLDVFDLGFSV